MVYVVTEIEINEPLHKVAEFAANPDNAPTWYENIKSVTWITKKPLRVGSKITFIAHFLGKKLEYTYEVTTFNPLKKLVMETAQGPFPMQTTYTWEAINPLTTKMILTNDGTPSGFSKFFSFFISRMMRNANRKDLRKLKTILEANDKK
jgi:uncharacterized membrane protein